MPRGSKSKYTSKQKRRAEHIEESYKKRGASGKEAERRAWATVNKEAGAASGRAGAATEGLKPAAHPAKAEGKAAGLHAPAAVPETVPEPN